MNKARLQTSSRTPISSSTWFITGINRGLGRNIAEEVLRRGGRVAGTVRNLSSVDRLKQQFPDRLWIKELDLSDSAKIASAFQTAVDHFGRIHSVFSAEGNPMARVVNVDKNPAYPAAVRELKAEGWLPRRVRLRSAAT